MGERLPGLRAACERAARPGGSLVGSPKQTWRGAYLCVACGVTTGVLVRDLGDPLENVSESTLETLRRGWVLRETVGVDPGPEPVGQLAAQILEGLARGKLKFVACPRCGVRNPEGSAALRSDRVGIRLVGVGLAAGLATTVWFWPVVGVALALSSLLLGVFNAGRAAVGGPKGPLGVHAAQVLAPAGLLAVAWWAPTYAIAVPLALTLPALFRKGDDESRWQTDDVVFDPEPQA